LVSRQPVLLSTLPKFLHSFRVLLKNFNSTVVNGFYPFF
jgi:hypothetical protein